MKRQIHPHFLFNKLNTIYGFALKQSNQTPEIILKLSNLPDYILYQVNKPRVSISEEVSHKYLKKSGQTMQQYPFIIKMSQYFIEQILKVQ